MSFGLAVATGATYYNEQERQRQSHDQLVNLSRQFEHYQLAKSLTDLDKMLEIKGIFEEFSHVFENKLIEHETKVGMLEAEIDGIKRYNSDLVFKLGSLSRMLNSAQLQSNVVEMDEEGEKNDSGWLPRFWNGTNWFKPTKESLSAQVV